MAWRTGSSVVGLGKQALQVPAAIRDIMQSGGENAGLTAASQIVPRTAGGVAATAAMEKAPAIADKLISTPVRIALQRAGGAGKEPVLLEAMARERQLAERASTAARTHQEWLNKAMEVKREQAEVARNVARKQVLDRGIESYGKRLLDNIQQTHENVKTSLNQRWNQLRSHPINRGGVPTVLKDQPLNSTAIADSIETAEKKFLAGSPESIKQFRDLMNFMETKEAPGFMAGSKHGALNPITWDEGRIHYSALGDRMFSGDLPGNVRAAIRYVRDEGLGSQLHEVAGKAGAGQQYSSLLKDWSQYEHDWRDMSSVTTGGGSPLARAKMAPNAATLTPQVLGKTGDLLMERLAKYRQFGGSPSTAAAIRKLASESKSITRLRAPELPPRPRTPEALPEIDPVAIRRKRLTQYAARPIEFWDLVNPVRWIERPAMSSEAIREWVARQPRKELEP